MIKSFDAQIVFCSYCPVRSPKALNRAIQFMQELGFKVNRKNCIIILNSDDVSPEIFGEPQCNYIRGSNSLREFSAYQEGLNVLYSQDVPVNGIVGVFNDTFTASYGDSYLSLFNKKKIYTPLNYGCLVGYTDCYSEPVKFFGTELKSWIRSSLVLGMLGSFARVGCLDDFDNYPSFFKPFPEFISRDFRLSNEYCNLIESWLFAKKINDEQVDFWHSSEPLSKENHKKMSEKAKCIFSEHWLSLRAKDKGVGIYSVSESRYLSPPIS